MYNVGVYECLKRCTFARPGPRGAAREGEAGMPVATEKKQRRTGAPPRGGSLAAGLPCGRRTPRGRERWYLPRMPQGREESLCAELRRLVPPPS